MKVAIIGAGAGGLAALRHCLEDGHECEVFEKTNNIGGTWVYNEKTGLDSNGLPIHSSMYAGLKTNLPKELMVYEDWPYKEPHHSFISQAEVLNYIQNFVKAFNLSPHIKFLTHVVKVTPLRNNRWVLKIEDLTSETFDEKEFDAVIVCVGNYSVPNRPKFQGIENFKGSVIHSHDYRVPEIYTKKRVLVIGSGPSAVDIARIIEDHVDKIFISFRGQLFLTVNNKICKKPIVKEFRENSVIFMDNSEEDIDSVIFCTGYLNSYPYLSSECGIEVENNWVKYLYKHIINVKKPTMAFIGIPTRIIPFPIFGIQVRYFLAYLKGQFSASEEEMMNDVMAEVQNQLNKNLPMHYYHRLGLEQGLYMAELAEQANIKSVPPVLGKLYIHHHLVEKGDRTAIYRIINDEEFIRIGTKSD